MLLRMVNLSFVAAIASRGHDALTSALKPAIVLYWRNLLRSIPVSFELMDASWFNGTNFSMQINRELLNSAVYGIAFYPQSVGAIKLYTASPKCPL
jgi:hypothetical protein